ncbi:polyketide cyclase/dehydrase/lipid transport protein [Nocardia pseudobrasiliensis]|uniref:Polyketide cyclase/dehydrase/lipid transport protein n=2 Tax=Nocardia pseudobrasiliensis TaxID=45979 RepID=A0A370IBT1_9NOCA|nr:polyketide cyclase/dehydrase/lipid transport protein [Nocardia pseudobrasiliensis]
MITIITAVEQTIAASPEDLYDLVSVPANWPELIPSSERVEGGTRGSAAVGARFADHIRDPVTGLQTRLDYIVRRAERGKVFEFSAEEPFGRPDVGYTVTYSLEPAPDGTTFRREARTEYSERRPLPRDLLDATLSEPVHGSVYLDNVRAKFEPK